MSARPPRPARFEEPAPEWAARPCPFCGWVPSIVILAERCIISCEATACAIGPSVTGPTRAVALDAWNTLGALDPATARCERCACTQTRACPGGCAWDPEAWAAGRALCTRCTGAPT